MKKLFVFAAAAIFAAALAVSCQNIEVVSDVQHDYRTATIVLPDPGSKLAISETDGKVAWEVGDVINIHGKAISEMQTYTLKAEDISADGRSAVITYDAASMEKYGVDDYYAQYPAGAVKVFMSGSSAYHYAEFNNTNLPLMAAYLKDGAFNFRNLCGIISFKVTGDFDSYAFSGNNDEVVGYSQYAIKHTSEETYTKDESSGEILVLKGAVATDGTTANLLCIPGGKEFTEGFTIKLLKGDTIVKVAKTTKSIEVGRSDLLPLGDITSVLVDYVPDTHQNKITDATNLGATETANCYIIDKAGSYKIPAVKGNSNESVGTVAGVKLLWETYNSDQEVAANSVIAAVDYEEDAVFFRTPDSLMPGNALIAALDANEVILWSWHIWIPATGIVDLEDGNFYNKALMDRNLGALEAVPDAASAPSLSMFGLYYQWGRKDPMFTSNWQRNATLDITYSGSSEAGVTVTTEESIKNPTTYYYSQEGGTYNWNSSELTDLWEDDTDKTIYDPCPAGYRVPKYDTNLAMWKYNVATGWTDDKTNGWFKYGSITFPYAGYASGSSLSYGGIRSVIWSSTYKDVERGSAIYIRSDKNPIYNYHSYYKPYLGSVRCCKIDGEVSIPEAEPAKAATDITIDGQFSDWSDGEAIAGDGSYIIEWKYGYDASNIYFYFKIPKAKINYDDKELNSDGTPNEDFGYYTHKRYIYVAFDTDNNKETGATPSLGGLKIPGCEALALIFPWRGHKDDPSAPSIVNGTDEEGWLQSPLDADADGNPVVQGAFDGDYALLEVALAKDKLGSPNAGTFKIQFSYSWNLTDIFPIAIK